MSIPTALEPIVYLVIVYAGQPTIYSSYPDHATCWKASSGFTKRADELRTCLTRQEMIKVESDLLVDIDP